MEREKQVKGEDGGFANEDTSVCCTRAKCSLA